jgi:hypothetical protein
MTAGYRDFEFDLPGALLVRLVEVLDGMEAAPLDAVSLSSIPEQAQGVYQLFLDEDLVYIGKTDAEAGLGKRLGRHHEKIQHRNNLDPAQVFFKAVRVYVFTAVDLETQLINRYGGERKVTWNGSGFGSNDPGRERDTTKYKDDHFDVLYPIDIDRVLTVVPPAQGSAATILSALKNILPYTFRYENAGGRSRQPHPDLLAANVTLPIDAAVTARGVISAVVPRLPPGWQAVRFPSHIILYKDDKNYVYGTQIARS